MPNRVPEAKRKAEPLKIEAKPAAASGPVSKPKKAKESGCVMRFCVCASPFQDARYGKGRRVFTCTPKGAVRCTVCGRQQ